MSLNSEHGPQYSDDPEGKLDRPQKILFIESQQSHVDLSIEFLCAVARKKNIPLTKENFKWEPNPPETPEEFKALLSDCSAAVLHNLSYEDLGTITKFLGERREFGSRLVIVQTSAMMSSEYEFHYQILEAFNVQMVRKPFSLHTIVDRVLGII